MMKNAMDQFGENVFGLSTMEARLSKATFEKLQRTIGLGEKLDARIADEVALAMKDWAIEKGATHYTHWFQPLTGATAEKHDSFLFPDASGGAVTNFSGKELIQGEPDASSFPSGGLRATFEARGYTGWDPTSPAFIKYEADGALTLCIPSVFCGYHGEALDKKTPLLRSMKALSEQAVRLAELFGESVEGMVMTTLGSEQEYFLIDATLVKKRPDLMLTGRTLFGSAASKDQQLDDHYFGSIKPRIAAFMAELDSELWKLGVPATTRHNEVCPCQFEIAPVFEPLNQAVDHNMLVMEALSTLAEEHGFVCLLHEKPFAGLNGSGKHNNWSIMGPDGKNWLKPGDNPHENAKFMALIVALMQAVDRHADLLRASVASAGNDHRLGANEAPPAIISLFLGDQLSEIISQIEEGGATGTTSGGLIHLGLDMLPALPRGNTDRNRTSPLAFVGNRFEFRAVGSAQNPANANVILNTIMAEAIDELVNDVTYEMEKGETFHSALQDLLAIRIKKHKRILFNGDGYTEAWLTEAKQRGLLNLRTTPEALQAYETPKAQDLFAHYGIFSHEELAARYKIYVETYETLIQIEQHVACDMVQRGVIPAVACTLRLYEGNTALLDLNAQLQQTLSEMLIALDKLTEAENAAQRMEALENLREPVDKLEAWVPADLWPFSTYSEMLMG